MRSRHAAGRAAAGVDADAAGAGIDHAAEAIGQQSSRTE